MSETYPPTPNRLVTGGSAATPGAEQFYPPTPGGEGGSSGGAASSTATAAARGPGFKRQDFIKNYANMVARTWVDDSYLDLVVANPVSALTRAGLAVPDGSTVRVIQHKITGSGQISDQVDAWVEGNRTGLFDLFLPMRPDDVDIDGSGGGEPVGGCAGGNACCCCSPCCCCT